MKSSRLALSRTTIFAVTLMSAETAGPLRTKGRVE
jgi:hypothetical protein